MQNYFSNKKPEVKKELTTGWIGKGDDGMSKELDDDDHFDRFVYKGNDNNTTSDKRKLPSSISDTKSNNQHDDKDENINTNNTIYKKQAINLDFIAKLKDEKENNKKKSYIEKKRREEFFNDNAIKKHEAADTKELDENAQISLSQSQYRVLKAILQGKSVFYTGAAGTGKSYILRVFQDVMDYCDASSTFYLTAPTGVAACNIGGQTIHTWAGIGQYLDHKDPNFINQMGRSNESKSRWKTAKLLVIDEISMLSAELFDALNTGGKRVRANNSPFGGIQMVVCGDFFQLPPIGVNSRDANKKVNYCFHSDVWDELFGHDDGMIVLDKVFRQKEQMFLDMLNELRRGIVSDRNHNILMNKCTQTTNEEARNRNLQATKAILKSDEKDENDENETPPNIVPTKLFPTNKDVEMTNERELEKLIGETEVYEHQIEGKTEFKKQLLQGMKAPPTLVLKLNAQVMLLKNKDVASGLVNGTRGEVVGFTVEGENATASDGGCSAIFANRRLPIVKFHCKSGNSSYYKEVTLKEETWELKSGELTMASYTQIPLMLAWAISIHKSQGMTITDLEVSFNGMFEYGQAYVSLSRATDFDRLKLRGYQRYAVKSSKEVNEFYQKLGYKTESFHKEDSTVFTTIKELSDIYFANDKAKPPPNPDKDDGWLEDPKSSKQKKGTAVNINFGMSKHQESLTILPISQNQRDIIEKTKLEARTVVELSDDDDEEIGIEKMSTVNVKTLKTPFAENPMIANSKTNITPIVYGNAFMSPLSTLAQGGSNQSGSKSNLTDEQRKKIEQNKALALEKKRKREQELLNESR